MSNWKKSTVLGLTTAVIFSMVSPVYANEGVNQVSEQTSNDTMEVPETKEATEKEIAEANISKDEAIALAKTHVEIPSDFEQVSINFNSRHYRSGHGVWDIHFEKKETEKGHHAYTRVSIDAENGKLIGFNLYDSSRESTYPPKVDLSKAKEIAQQFLEQHNQDILSSLQYNEEFERNHKTPLQGDVRYRFQFDRLENGVPFPTNHISIAVDGSGNVVDYNYAWDESVDFASTEQSVDLGQAADIFNGVEFDLVFKIPWMEREKVKEPYLAYQMRDGFIGIDAKTGEFLNYRGEPFKEDQDYTPLTNAPIEELPSEDLQLNQDEALKRLTETFDIPDTAELENARFEENRYHHRSSNRSLWNFNWRIEGEDGRFNQHIWASIDSQTGEILNFNVNRYRPYVEKDSQEAPKLSADEAKEKALNEVKKLTPYYTNQLYLTTPHFEQLDEEELNDLREYSFTFNRIINGVRSEMDNVRIGIDSNTGEVVQYSNNMTDIAYPSEIPDVVNHDQAREIYFSQYDIQLQYHLFNGSHLYGPKEQEENEPKVAELVYQLVPKFQSQPVFLDAQTGQWRNHESGNVTTLEKIEATDIEDHWAEKQLQLMIDYEAIDVIDGKVMPNKKITRGELIKMLVVSTSGGHYRPYYGMERSASFADVKANSAYFSYVETAVDQNLIDKESENFYPDQTISRDEMAGLIVRALGYSALAEFDGIFSLNVNDATDVKNKGSVAIVMGLEIMTSSESKFNPDKEVTRAEAAMAFYRYLEKRSLLEENNPF
jgi:Zn-dependent metalloprotease